MSRIDWAHPLQGQSPYSASKIGADKLAESFQCSFGLPVVTVRPLQHLRPAPVRAGGDTDDNHPDSSVTRTVRLGNLLPTRDLNYVTNTVNGYILAASSAEAIGQTINLGSGREISIGDLAKVIGKLTGREIQIESESGRARPENSEVERLLADNGRARTLLGWESADTPRRGLNTDYRLDSAAYGTVPTWYICSLSYRDGKRSTAVDTAKNWNYWGHGVSRDVLNESLACGRRPAGHSLFLAPPLFSPKVYITRAATF